MTMPMWCLLLKTGVCDLSIWARLNFRIQLNDWLNYITDINNNKNPHSLVEIDTSNDFLSMGFTLFLMLMKQRVFKHVK